jgi:hypothetical protein
MAVDDLLYVELVGERNLTRNLDRMPDTVRAILLDKVEAWTHRMAEAVRANILARLGQKSGSLLNAVQEEVRIEGGRIEGRVYIAGVPHAVAQEKGAIIPPHIIRPRNAKILAFFGATGEKVFATRVSHPGGQIKPQFFMKDAYRDMGPEISRGIKKAVVDGIRANMRRS